MLHVTVLSTFVSIASGLAAGPPTGEELECGHAKRGARMLRGAPAMLSSGAADTDLQHYALDIAIDPATEWIEGTNTLTVRSVVDGLDAFDVRLDDAFTIGAIDLDGVPAPWQRLDSATIRVTLDPPFGVDDEFELAVGYAGSPQEGGFGSIIFRSRAGHPEAWTLSEPWYAHTWWPVKEDNRDKSTADLWFTVPEALRVASNGTLQGVDDVGAGRLRYRWKTEYQTADYLYCFGATNYDTFGATWEHGTASMPLEFYIYPEENTPDNRAAWLENADMLDVFSARFGLYPFVDEKYGMCQVGFGGGMEHQTMTSQGGFWESITAHELGHQWYGDMITCATWHDIWLNEGFATWSEAIWFGDKPGASEQGYHDRMEARRPGAVDDSVYVYDATDVGRIFSGTYTYKKAAWAIHMLRHVLTDEVWWDVLAAYRDAFAYSSATTEDFRAIAENVADRDLEWFFDEWIYGIGAPAYRWAWQAHEVAGRRYVEVFIKQVQTSSFPVFAMPVDVEINGSDVHVLWNDAAQEHLLFEVDDPVTSAALDPLDWILVTSKQATGFLPGPPKIVATTPVPGATLRTGAWDALAVVFHEDVVATPADFALHGAVSGPAAFDLTYDAGTSTATLGLGALAPDTYTLTVADTLLDAAADLALDGEIAAADDPSALPSGDGIAGGDATMQFILLAAGDVDGDGLVNTSDLLAVLAAWGPCAGCAEDLDGDGAVSVGDLLEVLEHWS